MASRRWLRGQSDVTVSLSAPRLLTTLGASRSTGPFDEVRRVYGDFATALPPHRSGGKVRSATGMIGCVGPIPARVRLLPGRGRRRGSRTGIGRYGPGRVSRPGCVRGQILAAMTPGPSVLPGQPSV